MALVICTECGNRISDRAMRCPKCGAPVKPPVDKYYIERPRKNRKYLVPAIFVVVLVVVAFGVYTFFNMVGNQSERDKTIASKIEETKANTAQAKVEAVAARVANTQHEQYEDVPQTVSFYLTGVIGDAYDATMFMQGSSGTVSFTSADGKYQEMQLRLVSFDRSGKLVLQSYKDGKIRTYSGRYSGTSYKGICTLWSGVRVKFDMN